ncbi:calcium-binding protein, partial [Paramylibacter ulvae]|uniref:calcium-binding protein n=1 Tax=Paramylibacter ulvae TaxID=1651968 RepID=UPI00227D8F30
MADGTVTGTSGNDTITTGSGFSDLNGDSIDSLDNNQGQTGLERISWDNFGNDEQDFTTLTTSTGTTQVVVTVTQGVNFDEASIENGDDLYNYNGADDNSSIHLQGGGGNGSDAATLTFDFSTLDPSSTTGEVNNVVFGLFDMDVFPGQFNDEVEIHAYDADGNEVPIVFTGGNLVDPNTVDGSNTNAQGVEADDFDAFVQVSIAGPVAQIVLDYRNTDTNYGTHAIRVGDLEFNSVTPGDNTDDVRAGDGDDTVDTGLDDDTAYGEAGDDTLSGGAGNDTLYGGADNDTLLTDSGNDTLDGGQGDDTFVVTDGFGTDTIVGGEDAGDTDTDVLDLSGLSTGADVTYTGNEAGTVSNNGDSATFSEIEEIILTDQDDTLDGSASTDGISVVGGEGNDDITTGSGDDVIDTSNPNDPDYDGIDNTTDDLDTVFAGAGDDSIFTGDDADSIDGGAGNDTIDGGIDDDTISGGAGNDSIIGGDGNDLIDGGAGNDTIDAGNSPNPDTDDVDADPSDDLDTVFGGTGDDSIATGDDADTIDGGTGNDTI